MLPRCSVWSFRISVSASIAQLSVAASFAQRSQNDAARAQINVGESSCWSCR